MTYRRSRSVPPHRIGRPRGCYPRVPSTKAVRRGGPTTFHQPNRDAQIKGRSYHLCRRRSHEAGAAALAGRMPGAEPRPGAGSGCDEPPGSVIGAVCRGAHSVALVLKTLSVGETAGSRPSRGNALCTSASTHRFVCSCFSIRRDLRIPTALAAGMARQRRPCRDVVAAGGGDRLHLGGGGPPARGPARSPVRRAPSRRPARSVHPRRARRQREAVRAPRPQRAAAGGPRATTPRCGLAPRSARETTRDRGGAWPRVSARRRPERRGGERAGRRADRPDSGQRARARLRSRSRRTDRSSCASKSSTAGGHPDS